MVVKNEVPTPEPEVNVGELETLKQERRFLVGEIESKDAAITRLAQTVTGKESEIAVLKQAIGELEERVVELKETLAQAVASYKATVIEQNPGMLAELISGDTVAEIDESLKNAQSLIERVRQEMEAEASKTRVPAGAPQRAPLDLSALSPREKIQYAIGGFSS